MKKEIKKDQIQEQVLKKVIDIRKIMPKIGGKKMYHILKSELDQQGIKLGRDKFFDILRQTDMLVQRKKKYTITTNSRHWMKIYSNLVKELSITGAEQVWVSDITYLTADDGFYYLSLITDAYTKKIIGYKLSRSLDAFSSLQALRMALKHRRHTQPLIHHSDRGIQYCSKEYTETLRSNGISISMTEKSDPYENAIAERVNGILKEEFGIDTVDSDFENARKAIDSAVIIYNTKRPHLSCGMLTPEQADMKGRELKKMWKSYQRFIKVK